MTGEGGRHGEGGQPGSAARGTPWTAADIAALLAGRADMMGVLRAVAALGLPDSWVGAGFVRNAVWDALHGRLPGLPGLADVDVLFFDPADIGRDREAAAEARLALALPGVPWSVRNQARMHLRNGDAPYRDTGDAVRHWLETATAVAVRLDDARIELLAPHGINDLVCLVLRPGPAALKPGRLPQYRARVLSKDWARRWPKLTVLGLSGPVQPDGARAAWNPSQDS